MSSEELAGLMTQGLISGLLQGALMLAPYFIGFCILCLLAVGRCIGGPLRPTASSALAVLQKACCSSSPAPGHVIHALPRPGATEQNNGCCCKISGRKLFSHSFQWFSFRPVSAVISQQNLDSFCSIAYIVRFLLP